MPLHMKFDGLTRHSYADVRREITKDVSLRRRARVTGVSGCFSTGAHIAGAQPDARSAIISNGTAGTRREGEAAREGSPPLHVAGVLVRHVHHPELGHAVLRDLSLARRVDRALPCVTRMKVY